MVNITAGRGKEMRTLVASARYGGPVNQDIVQEFGLDPAVVHLNHGAFGCAPVSVRREVTGWQYRAERNPHRFNRIDLPILIADARGKAAEFLGLDAQACALVRNVSEGISAVLGSLDLTAGDEIVLCSHGYGAVRIAVQHWAARRGAVLVQAEFGVGAGRQEIVDAYRAAVTTRTVLVVVDQITSPTATALPVAEIAAAVGVPVLVDAAHAPGTVATDIGSLGATYWIGNLHKWAYTPRGTAMLWSAPDARDTTFPAVLSWQLWDGYARSFDYPGTWDYSGWLAAPTGLAYWAGIGGWDRVRELTALVEEGRRLVAGAIGVDQDPLPAEPAPTMRLVRLPAGRIRSQVDADNLYEHLSTIHRIEVAPVFFGGDAFLRIAAAPYNTVEDYAALANALTA